MRVGCEISILALVFPTAYGFFKHVHNHFLSNIRLGSQSLTSDDGINNDESSYERMTAESIAEYNSLAMDEYYHNQGEEEDDEDVYEMIYCAETGLESLLVSLGNSRPFLATEYEIAFRRFPNLIKLASNHPDVAQGLVRSSIDDNDGGDMGDENDVIKMRIKGKWPTRKLQEDELENIITTVNYLTTKTPATIQANIDESLSRFLATIKDRNERSGGGSFGSTAGTSYTLLKNCLSATAGDDHGDGWLVAASALESSGLTVMDHVECIKTDITMNNHSNSDSNTTDIDIKNCEVFLDVASLWSQARTQLLDATGESIVDNIDSIDSIDSSTTSVISSNKLNSHSATDQDRRVIQDLLLAVMRVSVKMAMVRANTSLVGVHYPSTATVLDPSEITVKVVLATEYRLLYEPDEAEEIGSFMDTNEDDRRTFILSKR